MIDCGTFQVGLTVMNFIVSVSSGVACVGLPTTTRVFQTCWPLFITLRWKSGMLSATCVAPRLRGIQRQRSSVATTASIWLWRLGPLSESMVAAVSWPLAVMPFDF